MQLLAVFCMPGSNGQEGGILSGGFCPAVLGRGFCPGEILSRGIMSWIRRFTSRDLTDMDSPRSKCHMSRTKLSGRSCTHAPLRACVIGDLVVS